MQFVPLLGEHGLEPVGPLGAAGAVPRVAQLFYLLPERHRVPRGRLAGRRAVASFALSSVPQRLGTRAGRSVWAVLWVLYLSFVNIGQTFYGFGWETLLCEVGFFTIFAGAEPRGAEHVADLDLAMDAVPPDVRRRPDQAARRLVLARSHVPRTTTSKRSRCRIR